MKWAGSLAFLSARAMASRTFGALKGVPTEVQNAQTGTSVDPAVKASDFRCAANRCWRADWVMRSSLRKVYNGYGILGKARPSDVERLLDY